jgi:hypothetical protein
MSDLLKEAKELYKEDEEYWREIYDEAEEDELFMSGDPGAQWNSQDYRTRKNSGKPVLEIDQLSQFEKQVANEIRRNTPSIKVVPAGSDASMEDAEIYRGIIRAIEYKSNADVAYDTGVACAIRSSFGFIKVTTDYSTETGFDQELKIERVINPRAFMIDSRSTSADGSDAMHAWEEEPPLSVKEFKKLYPDCSPMSFGQNKAEKDASAKVTITRWYRIEEEKFKIGQLADGTIEEAQKGVEYEAQREVTARKVKIYRMTGQEIIETLDFPGKYVPIIPVYGEEQFIAGKRKLFSLVRRSKDGQRMFNVWKSLEAEMLLQQPRAPILAAVGQTEDFAEEYSNPDKVAVLRYKQVDINGQAAPAPQRLAPPQIPAGIVNGARESVDDIKATMGIYNASLGAQSNETSGIAIQARKLQGDSATYHFGDNLVRSITQVGRILVAAIPEVYDAPRIIQIINSEETPEPVGINGAMADKQDIPHFLDAGQFDVRVMTGQSYATKRQETSAMMTQMLQANPELMKVAGDLFFKYMDVEGSEALSARFKKILPPELQDTEQGENQDPRVPQMQQIIEQGLQHIQQLQAALEQSQQELQSKQAELAMKAQETQNKATKDQYEIQIKAAQLEIDQQQQQIEAYRAETERLKLMQETGGKEPKEQEDDDDDEIVLAAKAESAFHRRIKGEEMQKMLMQHQEVKSQRETVKMQQTDAIANILLSIKDSIDAQAAAAMQQTQATQQLAATIAAPRVLVTDKTGAPVGTRTSGVIH